MSQQHIASSRQFALFLGGFRPFFLLAGLDALVNMGVWLCAYFHPEFWPAEAIPAMYWHAHEMLFGFAAAAIGGFLLTAAPGWTGRSSYSGTPLVSLAALWLAALQWHRWGCCRPGQRVPSILPSFRP